MTQSFGLTLHKQTRDQQKKGGDHCFSAMADIFVRRRLDGRRHSISSKTAPFNQTGEI